MEMDYPVDKTVVRLDSDVKQVLTFSLLFRGFFNFVLCFFAGSGFADFSAYVPRLDILDRAPKDLLGIRGRTPREICLPSICASRLC